MTKLKFGICKNCNHEVVFFQDQWKHHTTRAKLYHVPHWPTGHVITIDCKWDCKCSIPELDESKRQNTKLVLLDIYPEK